MDTLGVGGLTLWGGTRGGVACEKGFQRTMEGEKLIKMDQKMEGAVFKGRLFSHQTRDGRIQKKEKIKDEEKIIK